MIDYWKLDWYCALYKDADIARSTYSIGVLGGGGGITPCRESLSLQHVKLLPFYGTMQIQITARRKSTHDWGRVAVVGARARARVCTRHVSRQNACHSRARQFSSTLTGLVSWQQHRRRWGLNLHENVEPAALAFRQQRSSKATG